MVSVSDSQSSGSGFEARSDHYLDMFLRGSPKFKSSAALGNSQLVCLRPVPNLKYLFQLFARPTSIYAVNIAEGI